MLLVDFFVTLALAVYLSNVLPDAAGRRRHPLYFLDPRYWMGSEAAPHVVVNLDDDMDDDVKAEAVRVRDRDYGERKILLEVRGLRKTFYSIRNFCLAKFEAVRGVSLAVEENTVFTLLGHNGAGKTTAITCLTGLTTITGGDAAVAGHSVVTDMDTIRSSMGVCPQHDVLWDLLSAHETLELFARLKGVPEVSVATEVSARLEEVQLEDCADQLAGTFSGGMRRRLSIALALIGNPRIVFQRPAWTL